MLNNKKFNLNNKNIIYYLNREAFLGMSVERWMENSTSLCNYSFSIGLTKSINGYEFWTKS